MHSKIPTGFRPSGRHSSTANGSFGVNPVVG